MADCSRQSELLLVQDLLQRLADDNELQLLPGTALARKESENPCHPS